MRRKFWQFVHRNLERAWHWVYYKKIAPNISGPAYSDRYSGAVYWTTRDGKTFNQDGEEVQTFQTELQSKEAPRG